MGIIVGILNGVQKGVKAIRDIYQLTRNLINKGINASRIMNDPRMLAKLAAKKILDFLIGAIKYYVAIFLLIVMAVLFLIQGVSFIMESFMQSNNFENHSSTEMIAWANALTDDEVAKMIEEGASFNPKKVSMYVEEEDKSYPKKVNVKKKIINNSTVSYEDYELDLTATSKQYRTMWQFLAALDIVNETALDTNNKDVVNNAEIYLRPKYEWGYDTLTKDITTYSETWSVTYKDDVLDEVGDTSSDSTTEVYPLPYLKRVTTGFKTINFSYEMDKKTKDTNWSSRIKVGERKWVEREEAGKDKDGKTVYKDVRYKEITYKRVKTTTIEDVLVNSEETPNYETINTFMGILGILNDDLNVVYEIVSQIPDTSLLQDDLEEFLGNGLMNIGNPGGGYEGTPIVIEPGELVREIPYFSQKDPRWGNIQYGYGDGGAPATIATSGCGPTSAAMVITGLGGKSTGVDLNGDTIIDPYEAAMYALKKGHRVNGQGTSRAYFKDIGNTCGLKVNQYSTSDYKTVLEELQKGNPVIAIMGAGHFTNGGHYIVLVGVDGNGKIIVNDSNSVKRSHIAWDYVYPIIAEANAFWVFEK